MTIFLACCIVCSSLFGPVQSSAGVFSFLMIKKAVLHQNPGIVTTNSPAEDEKNSSPTTADVEFDFSEDTFTFGAAVPTTGNMKNSSSSSDVAIEIPKELHPPKITTAEREKRGPSKFKGKRNLKLNTEENAFGDPKLKIR